MKTIGVVQPASAIPGLVAGGNVLWVPVKLRNFLIEGARYREFDKDPENGSLYMSGSGMFPWTDIEKWCPVQPGDVVWVKETWSLWLRGSGPHGFVRLISFKMGAEMPVKQTNWKDWDCLVEKSDRAYDWRSPVTMPRWASRIERTVTAVGRVEQRDGVWCWRIEGEPTGSAGKGERP